MARTTKRQKQAPVPEREYFIFEIKDWEPEYRLSVGRDRYRRTPYTEYVRLRFTTVCVHPKKWAARGARITATADPNFMAPEAFKRDPDWKPDRVAGIYLPPTDANFSFSVPMEAVTFLMTALSHGLFRYLLFWGPPLSRGWSLCTELHFARTVDLNDY